MQWLNPFQKKFEFPNGLLAAVASTIEVKQGCPLSATPLVLNIDDILITQIGRFKNMLSSDTHIEIIVCQ